MIKAILAIAVPLVGLLVWYIKNQRAARKLKLEKELRNTEDKIDYTRRKINTALHNGDTATFNRLSVELKRLHAKRKRLKRRLSGFK